jgi:hypothetical protein
MLAREVVGDENLRLDFQERLLPQLHGILGKIGATLVRRLGADHHSSQQSQGQESKKPSH